MSSIPARNFQYFAHAFIGKTLAHKICHQFLFLISSHGVLPLFIILDRLRGYFSRYHYNASRQKVQEKCLSPMAQNYAYRAQNSQEKSPADFFLGCQTFHNFLKCYDYIGKTTLTVYRALSAAWGGCAANRSAEQSFRLSSSPKPSDEYFFNNLKQLLQRRYHLRLFENITFSFCASQRSP